MSMKEYYIPAAVVRAVERARADDPRMGSDKPPKYAAYLHLLAQAAEKFDSQHEFSRQVLSWIIDDEKPHRVWLPIPDDMHAALRFSAKVYSRTLQEFAGALLCEAVKNLDYSQLEK